MSRALSLCRCAPRRVSRYGRAARDSFPGGDFMPDSTLSWALRYAALGWPVFPIRPKRKTPATKHGHLDATTDEIRIRDWWTRMPEAGIGIPTGCAFVVIDVDA